MPSFQIGDATTRLTLTPDNRTASVNFPIRNLTARPVASRIRVEPQGEAKKEWFAIEGAPPTNTAEVERDFEANGNHVAAVKVTVPPSVSGDYTFHLRVTEQGDPDTDSVVGPAVQVTAPPVPVAPPAKAPIPWWPFAVAALLLLLVGGGIGLAYQQGWIGGGGNGDAPQVAVPATEGKSHVEAAKALAAAGFDVAFSLTPEGTGAGLQALRSEPEAGEEADAGSKVDLVLKSPSGSCGSLICQFPNQIFPAAVVAVLAGQNFDPKFEPALSGSEGRVAIDQAKFDQILNPPATVQKVQIPALDGQDALRAAEVLSILNLGAEMNPLATGAEDGKIRNTIPQTPASVDPGTIVKVFYRPVARRRCEGLTGFRLRLCLRRQQVVTIERRTFSPSELRTVLRPQ